MWAINLLYELENIFPSGAAGQQDHCTDVYAVSPGGYGAGFALGHNEDWSKAVKPYWYWLRQSVRGSPACAGLAYPGTLIGYAPTWNEHGYAS